MLEIINSFTNDYLNPISTWIGIATSIPIVWTWYDVVWGQQSGLPRSRHRRWLKEVRQRCDALPYILIVDLLPGKNVRTAVEHFLSHNPALHEIPPERVFILQHDTWLQPEDAPLLIKKMRDVAAEVLHSGADVVHYFHANLANGFVSAIGHTATASVLSQLLERDITVNRINVNMLPGDAALVFRLLNRVAEGAVLSVEELANIGYELSWLTRLA